jgi:hypothetical protein
VSRGRFGWFDHKITSVKWLFNIFFNRDRFAKTNIPTLEQTVTQLLASGQRMFIDIKDHNKKFVKIIHSLFERHPALYSRAVVTSFYPIIIYLVSRIIQNIACYTPIYKNFRSERATQRSFVLWLGDHTLSLTNHTIFL